MVAEVGDRFRWGGGWSVVTGRSWREELDLARGGGVLHKIGKTLAAILAVLATLLWCC